MLPAGDVALWWRADPYWWNCGNLHLRFMFYVGQPASRIEAVARGDQGVDGDGGVPLVDAASVAYRRSASDPWPHIDQCAPDAPASIRSPFAPNVIGASPAICSLSVRLPAGQWPGRHLVLADGQHQVRPIRICEDPGWGCPRVAEPVRLYGASAGSGCTIVSACGASIGRCAW